METREYEAGTSLVDRVAHLHQCIGPGLLETALEATLVRKPQ